MDEIVTLEEINRQPISIDLEVPTEVEYQDDLTQTDYTDWQRSEYTTASTKVKLSEAQKQLEEKTDENAQQAEQIQQQRRELDELNRKMNLLLQGKTDTTETCAAADQDRAGNE